MITNVRFTHCVAQTEHCVNEIPAGQGQLVATKVPFGRTGFVCWSCAECLPIDTSLKVTVAVAKQIGRYDEMTTVSRTAIEMEFKGS